MKMLRCEAILLLTMECTIDCLMATDSHAMTSQESSRIFLLLHWKWLFCGWYPFKKSLRNRIPLTNLFDSFDLFIMLSLWTASIRIYIDLPDSIFFEMLLNENLHICIRFFQSFCFRFTFIFFCQINYFMTVDIKGTQLEQNKYSFKSRCFEEIELFICKSEIFFFKPEYQIFKPLCSICRKSAFIQHRC